MKGPLETRQESAPKMKQAVLFTGSDIVSHSSRGDLLIFIPPYDLAQIKFSLSKSLLPALRLRIPPSLNLLCNLITRVAMRSRRVVRIRHRRGVFIDIKDDVRSTLPLIVALNDFHLADEVRTAESQLVF